METINFMYWAYNYEGSMKDILIDCFGSHLGEHFYSKFNGFYEAQGASRAPFSLFMELTDDNKKALLNWVNKNYSYTKI